MGFSEHEIPVTIEGWERRDRRPIRRIMTRLFEENISVRRIGAVTAVRSFKDRKLLQMGELVSVCDFGVAVAC